jgi:hypothetical protein
MMDSVPVHLQVPNGALNVLDEMALLAKVSVVAAVVQRGLNVLSVMVGPVWTAPEVAVTR